MSATTFIPRGRGPSASSFGCSPLLMPTRFDLNDQIQRVYTYGGWAVFQPRFWIFHKCIAQFVSNSRILSQLQDRGNSMNFTDNSSRCWWILMNFLEGRDVSLATNHSVLVVIQITIRIQEFKWNFTIVGYGRSTNFLDLLPWRSLWSLSTFCKNILDALQ